MITVKVFLKSNLAHTFHVYTGLSILRDKGVIKLEFERDNILRSDSPFIRARVSDRIVHFDLSDSNKFLVKELVDSCDIYFKRMLLREGMTQKIHPFGLNYPVLYRKDSFLTRGYAIGGFEGLFRASLRRYAIFSSLFNVNISHRNALVGNFERLPALEREHRRVIFFTRLWNPANTKDEQKKHEREAMNEMRIKAIARLKEELGERFIGGIQRDDYSRKIASSSLIVDNRVVHKRAYLKNLRASNIGVANEGLEGSIGFKVAEYVAMSMPIVTTPISRYALPGEFSETQNYLSYNTVDQCVEQCLRLVTDDDIYLRMSLNNLHYYNSYLRPDVLMLNCLTKVLSV